jgi:hypothetical protein
MDRSSNNIKMADAVTIFSFEPANLQNELEGLPPLGRPCGRSCMLSFNRL